MVTGGRNTGRIGVITSREKHKGAIDICHLKDAAQKSFATRITNVMVIGNGDSSAISLPKARGIKLSLIEEQKKLYEKKSA